MRVTVAMWRGAVQSSVAATVDAVAHGIAGGGWDRVHPGEAGECGFGADPAGMRPRSQGDGGGDRPDAGLVEQHPSWAGVEEVGQLLGVGR